MVAVDTAGARTDATSAALALDRQLCFALYACAHQIQRLYRPWLETLSLTYPQYLVMLLLWQHGERTVGELASALRLDSGTLSPLLKRLQAAGLVDRRRATRDERRVVVAPTAAGQALRDRAHGLPEAIAAAACLPLAEIEGLRERLQQLLARVEAAEPPRPEWLILHQRSGPPPGLPLRCCAAQGEEKSRRADPQAKRQAPILAPSLAWRSHGGEG